MIGTVISGTVRTEDLMPAFASKLKQLSPNHDTVKAAYDYMAGPADNEDYSAQEILDELQDALTEYALPLCYFGSHLGDGSDYGFWPDLDAIVDARHSVVYEDDDGWEYLKDDDVWIRVSDHGNITICENVPAHRGKEIWSIA